MRGDALGFVDIRKFHLDAWREFEELDRRAPDFEFRVWRSRTRTISLLFSRVQGSGFRVSGLRTVRAIQVRDHTLAPRIRQRVELPRVEVQGQGFGVSGLPEAPDLESDHVRERPGNHVRFVPVDSHHDLDACSMVDGIAVDPVRPEDRRDHFHLLPTIVCK